MENLDLNVGDIVYKKHSTDDMEGWWIVESHNSEDYSGGWECDVIFQRKGPEVTNNFCRFTLYNFESQGLKKVGTLKDFPEWLL